MKVVIVILVLLFFACIVLIKAIFETRNFKITEYKIVSEDIPDEIAYNKIMLLSDLHNSVYGTDNKRLLDKIDEINADAIFFAGDAIVGSKGYKNEEGAKFLNNLSKKYTVYYANGNHEARVKQKEECYGSIHNDFIKAVDWSNIIKLENSYYDLCENVRIYGIEIDNSYFIRKRKMELSYVYELLGECDRNKYNILIAHNPRYFDEYSDWGANLVLSGHNHGGIIGIPGTTRGVLSPQYKLFEKYCRGHFRQSNHDMIVSAGMGGHTINLRLFNKPEIVIIELIPKAGENYGTVV